MDQKLSQLIEELTTSGESQLNAQKMEDKFFGEASSMTEGYAPCPLSPDLATPRESGLSGPQDEEQPCCSKDLVASAYHVGSVVGLKALPQTAMKDSSRDEDEPSDPDDFLRSHGLGSHKYTLDVEVPSDGLKVQENEDNLAVLHAARDSLKLIQNKFLPTVCSWVQRFTRAGTYSAHLKQAIDLKMELELALKKYEELNIEPGRGQRSRTEALEDSEDEDQDFVEVPEKEGYEPRIPDHLRAEYGLEPKAPLKTLEKGYFLGQRKPRSKQSEPKHPNLTDLRERTNTARARLEKKVFAKAAVQRVVAAMNQMDQKKHEKFANQFNYALK